MNIRFLRDSHLDSFDLLQPPARWCVYRHMLHFLYILANESITILKEALSSLTGPVLEL